MVYIHNINCVTRQKSGNLPSQTGLTAPYINSILLYHMCCATKLLNFVACLTSALE